MIKRKYIAPNAITAGNMCLGYLSIIESIRGDYIYAILFIVLAMICDGLDGKTARKFDAFSEFGKEFDSFSDAISFGLAPGILIFCILSVGIRSNLAIPVSFFYSLCGVMRLVKFNVTVVASSEKGDFSGMPIPNAAGMVTSYYLSSFYLNKYLNIDLFNIDILIFISVIASLLMVSTIPFKTPNKAFSFIPNKFVTIFIIISLITIIFSMFILTFSYAIINLVNHIKKTFVKDNDENENTLIENEEDLEFEEEEK